MALTGIFARPRRLALTLWLAMLLPLAQTAAVRHELSHLAGQEQRKPLQHAHSAACEECLAFAQVGTGASPKPAALVLTQGLSYALPAIHLRPGQTVDIARPRNRGPPLFL